MRGGWLIVALWAPSVAYAEPPPVIAVFPIQDSSGNLSPKALAQLGDYFSVKLTETGRFQVVPRKDLEAQLGDKKKDSYKACYDQACQIEIGREVAAQKLLHTQIVEVGGKCAVTATLYDLRVAATERAASQKGGCTEPEIVASLEAVAANLGGPPAAPPPPPITSAPPPPAPAPSAPKFTLRVEALPDDAAVLVDGQTIGKGTASLPVDPGSSHQVVIEREGFVSETRTIKLDRDESVTVGLAMTPERRASRSELIGGGVTAGMTLGGGPVFGISARAPTLRFGIFAWSLAELDLGFGAGPRTTVSTITGCENLRSESGGPTLCDEDPLAVVLFAASTGPAALISIDDTSTLQIGLSIAAHLLVAVDGQSFDDRHVGPSLQPSIRYLRRSDSAFGWGVGVKALIPLLSTCESTSNGDNPSVQQFVGCRSGSPVLIQAEVPFGYVD